MAALRFDVYPAEAVLPNGDVHRGVRVMITADEQIVVWRDHTGIAQPVYIGQITDSGRYPERGAFWQNQRLSATTPDGQLHINAAGPRGCNCGGSSLALLDQRSAETVLAST